MKTIKKVKIGLAVLATLATTMVWARPPACSDICDGSNNSAVCTNWNLVTTCSAYFGDF